MIFRRRKKGKDILEELSDIFADAPAGGIDCDLGAFARSSACEELFLNRFSADLIFAMAAKAGLVARLAEKGHRSPEIDLHRDDSRIHRLLFYSGRIGKDRLLIDLRLSERSLLKSSLPFPIRTGKNSLDVLVLEWLAMTDPRMSFSAERPPLPGQEKPGLGALDQAFRLIALIGREMQRDAVVTVPEHMHSALMYSRRFRCTDPFREGVLRALRRDLSAYPLHDISWAAETESIMEVRSAAPLRKEPFEQMMPLSREARDHFLSGKYRKACERATDRLAFRLDAGMMKERRKLLQKSGK